MSPKTLKDLKIGSILTKRVKQEAIKHYKKIEKALDSFPFDGPNYKRYKGKLEFIYFFFNITEENLK